LTDGNSYPRSAVPVHVDSRKYVVEVRAPDKCPAPETVGPFDVHVAVDVPEDFDDYGDREPEEIVRHMMGFTRPVLPESTPAQWKRFADVVLAWVVKHRDTLMRDDWISERYWLQNPSTSLDGA
jgi:hypothetical protein